MKRLTFKELIPLFIGILVVFSGNFLYFRLDLTQDKRYTLSEASQDLLSEVEENLHIKVYLEGELPSGFRRLRQAIKENLDDFRALNSAISYQFIDPTSIQPSEKRDSLYYHLSQKGIPPTNIILQEKGKKTEKLVFPGVVIFYKGKEISTTLLKGNKTASAQEQLNQSIENVEYQLISAIRQLTNESKKRIGLLPTYSRVPAARLADMIVSLQKFYEIYEVDLEKSQNLDSLDAIILVKPDRAIQEKEQYKIDQFLVKGGKGLFFIDPVRVDSIGREGTFATPLVTGLEELFFRYGVRINTTLIKDLTCAAIPLNVGNIGNKPQIQLVGWQYFPLLNTFSSSPIVRNLDAIYGRFVSTLDTVRANGIRKTPLILSSSYTKVMNTPLLVSYNEARKNPEINEFNQSNKWISCLLEGKFQSLFQNRILPSDERFSTFVSQAKESNKIIICGDGDLPMNDFDFKNKQPLPLGFDKFSGYTFANKDFVLHAVEYLLNENGVISSRNKQIRLRPLDKKQISEKALFWQTINTIVPMAGILVVGMIIYFYRKRRFSV